MVSDVQIIEPTKIQVNDGGLHITFEGKLHTLSTKEIVQSDDPALLLQYAQLILVRNQAAALEEVADGLTKLATAMATMVGGSAGLDVDEAMDKAFERIGSMMGMLMKSGSLDDLSKAFNKQG